MCAPRNPPAKNPPTLPRMAPATIHVLCQSGARLRSSNHGGLSPDRSHRIASLVARLAPFAGRHVHGSSVTSRFITLTVGPDTSRLCADSVLGHLRMANRAINRDNGHKCERREQTDANSRPASATVASCHVVSLACSRLATTHSPRTPLVRRPYNGEKLRRPALDSTQPWNIG